MITSVLLLIIYVACSSLGLVLLKVGLNNGTLITLHSTFLELKLHTFLMTGAVLYILSFLLNMIVMSRFNLSYVYPISAGLIYIAILVFSLLILKEQMSLMQVMGTIFILIGIIIMNIKKWCFYLITSQNLKECDSSWKLTIEYRAGRDIYEKRISADGISQTSRCCSIMMPQRRQYHIFVEQCLRFAFGHRYFTRCLAASYPSWCIRKPGLQMGTPSPAMVKIVLISETFGMSGIEVNKRREGNAHFICNLL